MGQLGDLREIIVIAKHIAIPQKRTKHELPLCYYVSGLQREMVGGL